MKTVYVAERGVYTNRGVVGIFDSPERAMAALPGTHWKRTRWAFFPNSPDRTEVRYHFTWNNELDSDDAGEVYEMDYTDEGPERPVDEAVVQTYRESDGRWDYLPDPDHAVHARSTSRSPATTVSTGAGITA